MLIAFLIAFQIVQVNSEFVRFDVCFLDTGAHPWEFRPHPKGDTFYARADQVIFVSPVEFRTEGIDCVRTCSAYGCKFVIGTIASVMEVLRGAGSASEESRK